mmetsp:Transcript_6962/g.20883  ORF Transcript_6962/g.20883 Transcript_6962/m.20883 type:complete len:82 (+) Transcript_6962:329-574(+)
MMAPKKKTGGRRPANNGDVSSSVIMDDLTRTLAARKATAEGSCGANNSGWGEGRRERYDAPRENVETMSRPEESAVSTEGM